MDSRSQDLPEPTLVVLPEPAQPLPPEPATRMAFNKPLVAALAVSALLHAIALYYWLERRPLKASTNQPPPALQIALRRAPADPKPVKGKAPAEKKPIPPGRADRPTATGTGSLPPTQNRPQTPSADAPTDKMVKTTSGSSLDLSAALNNKPTTAKPDNPRVFDPRLRRRIDRARAKRLRLGRHEPADKKVWQNVDGTTFVETGSGGCLKAARQQGRSFARDWYMTGCSGRLRAGEKLLRNMQRRIDAHNGKR